MNIGLPVHTAWDIGVDDAMAIWCFQVYPDHLDIVDYYEAHGQGFDLTIANGSTTAAITGLIGIPTTSKVREAGRLLERARGLRLLILLASMKPQLAPNEDLMDGINAGRKTIPFAAVRQERAPRRAAAGMLRAYRTGSGTRRRPRLQEDARLRLGLAWLKMRGDICLVLARADAASRRRRRWSIGCYLTGHDHGSVHGH